MGLANARQTKIEILATLGSSKLRAGVSNVVLISGVDSVRDGSRSMELLETELPDWTRLPSTSWVGLRSCLYGIPRGILFFSLVLPTILSRSMRVHLLESLQVKQTICRGQK